MSQSEQTPQVVRTYLSELATALAGVPSELAAEIEDGVAEELAGLNATDAVARIAELGDPMFIAAEAKANLQAEPMLGLRAQSTKSAPGLQSTQATHTQPAGATHPVVAATEARWYIIVASLFVAIGGVVIPVLGWIVGIVMVWMSKSWHTWEKVVGTLIPVALGALLVLGSLAISMFSQPVAVEPGMFVGLSGWHAAIVSVFVSPFFAGVWLLWRGLRR